MTTEDFSDGASIALRIESLLAFVVFTDAAHHALIGKSKRGVR
jgi:hypothetical protein